MAWSDTAAACRKLLPVLDARRRHLTAGPSRNELARRVLAANPGMTCLGFTDDAGAVGRAALTRSVLSFLTAAAIPAIAVGPTASTARRPSGYRRYAVFHRYGGLCGLSSFLAR